MVGEESRNILPGNKPQCSPVNELSGVASSSAEYMFHIVSIVLTKIALKLTAPRNIAFVGAQEELKLFPPCEHSERKSTEKYLYPPLTKEWIFA